MRLPISGKRELNMPRWQWLLKQLTRRLWVRATLIGGLGIFAAILAAVVEQYIPFDLPSNLGADAVDSILSILASSMLAVTTFSLSVMTSAYGSATNNVTPRATRLLIEDRVTQNVLSTFLGSFLFGIVGIIVLQIGAYGERGRAVLFVVTIFVILLVVISLLRWIDHLTRLGRVSETTSRVEEAAHDAMQDRIESPFLGGTPLLDPERDIPNHALPVTAQAIGHVQHIDMQALAECCAHYDVELYLQVLPGAFVFGDTPLAQAVGLRSKGEEEDEAARDQIRKAITIGIERSFDQDPRFGLAVLSEIASRALSTGINDAGTAIDVIGRCARLLAMWERWEKATKQPEVKFERVHVPPLSTADLFEDAFMLVARDGAGHIEVQLRLQKVLRALARLDGGDFRAAAMIQAQMAEERGLAGLAHEIDKARLRQAIAAANAV